MVRVLREDINIKSNAIDEAFGNMPKNEFDVIAEAREGMRRQGFITEDNESPKLLQEETEVHEEPEAREGKSVRERVENLRALVA